MNPIEKALAQAEKIQAANRDLERMTEHDRTARHGKSECPVLTVCEDEPVCPYPDGIWF